MRLIAEQTITKSTQSQIDLDQLVDEQFDKALSIPRAERLRKKVKPAKKVFPLMLD